jgi:hypothetical protein
MRDFFSEKICGINFDLQCPEYNFEQKTKFTEKIEKLFGKKPSKSLNPDTCVSTGATIQGSSGAQGIIGTSIQGSTGTSIQGAQGIIGTSIQGAQGIIGTSIQGAQGIIGTSIQGSTGTSIQGAAGAQGTAGIQGVGGAQGTQGANATTSITNNTNNYVVTATGGGTPFNGEQNMTFDGSTLTVSGSANVVNIIGSGSAALSTIFAVDGANGRLFEVSDDLSNSLFSVNTIAGFPVIEAFADNGVYIGKYGQEAIVVSGSGGDLQLSGSIKLPSLPTAADTNVVVFNSSTKNT